ncbi:hypothetical protein [Burkholderia anthina]|nr:hypothetical protein [Burkholderia anthina]
MDRKAGALAVYREYLIGMTIVLARCEWIGFSPVSSSVRSAACG